MGNKQEKESSKVSFEECKKEYFKAINKDMKQSIKKINTTLNIEKNLNQENDNWVEYLKQKFSEYCTNNDNTKKIFHLIVNYLNNIGETNENKHIYNLSIFLKKYMDDSIKMKQKNIIDTYFTNTEIENEKILEETVELSKDTILWRGSEFIFEDIEKIDHPLTAFIRYLGFILAEIYEKEYDKAQSNVLDQENFQNSLILNENKNLRESNIHINMKSEFSVEETSEDDSVFTIKKNRSEKNYKSAFFSPSNFYTQNKNLEEFFKQLQKEVLYISNILTGALIRFYNIKNSCNEKILEIFLEKIKDLFLRNDLYRVIYEIKSSLLSRKKSDFSANLIKLYNLKPYYFGTSPYFTQDREFRKILRKKTDEILKTKSENDKTFSHSDKKLLNVVKLQNNKTLPISKGGNLKWNYSNFGFNKTCELEGIKMNNYDTEVSKSILKIPFDETLLLLRKLNDCNSMLKRIDLMFMLRASILSEIDKFWVNIPLKMKYKSVDADNLLSIFIYLIIKSQMTNLLIDIEIIDCFLSKNIKLSRKGYFFSLFQSSIEYIIENINMEQLDFNIKEYNNNLKSEIKKININPCDVLDFNENLLDPLSEKENLIDNNNTNGNYIQQNKNNYIDECVDNNSNNINDNGDFFKLNSENYLTIKNIDYYSNLNIISFQDQSEK